MLTFLTILFFLVRMLEHARHDRWFIYWWEYRFPHRHFTEWLNSGRDVRKEFYERYCREIIMPLFRHDLYRL